QVEGRAKHGDRGSDASWALKSRFEIAIRGGIRTAESVLISVSWSCLLWHSFHHEGHEGARSQSRRKRRTRAFNFPPPRPAFATRCRPTSSPPRNSMKSVANRTCLNSVGFAPRQAPARSTTICCQKPELVLCLFFRPTPPPSPLQGRGDGRGVLRNLRCKSLKGLDSEKNLKETERSFTVSRARQSRPDASGCGSENPAPASGSDVSQPFACGRERVTGELHPTGGARRCRRRRAARKWRRKPLQSHGTGPTLGRLPRALVLPALPLPGSCRRPCTLWLREP